ncbi:hypothetical protein SDC9_117679 [bioreactor metagenome]|uniref:Uncharacterized protein n=1 Tax=bioreactor metagenome TaxID=1076179 RepID=A0A645C1C6_9ZZZZ
MMGSIIFAVILESILFAGIIESILFARIIESILFLARLLIKSANNLLNSFAVFEGLDTIASSNRCLDIS